MPGNTIISLTPLTLIFFAVACFAAVMLWRERHRREANFGRPGSPAAGDAAP
jgi:hypothetical protein